MCRFDLRRHQSNVASAFLLHCWRHCWRGALHYHPTPRWCARFIPYIPYISHVLFVTVPVPSRAFLTTAHCGADTIGCCSVPRGCSSPVLFSADFIRVHPYSSIFIHFNLSDVCQLLSMTVVHSWSFMSIVGRLWSPFWDLWWRQLRSLLLLRLDMAEGQVCWRLTVLECLGQTDGPGLQHWSGAFAVWASLAKSFSTFGRNGLKLTAMIFNMDYHLFTNLDSNSLCSKDCFHGPSTLVHWKLGWTWFKACTTSLVCTFLLQCFPLFGKWERLAVHDVTLFNFHLMATSWRHIELCEGSSYLFPCASCLTRHSHSLRAHSVCIHLRVLRALQWIQHGHVPCAHRLIVHIRSARWSFLHCQPSCFTACGDLPDLQYAAVYSNVWWGVIGSKYPHVSTASVPWQMWMLLIAAYLVPDTVDEDGEAKLWNSLKQLLPTFGDFSTFFPPFWSQNARACPKRFGRCCT